jgi:hypothetical protein
VWLRYTVEASPASTRTRWAPMSMLGAVFGQCKRDGDRVPNVAELFEDSPVGEERGAVRAFRHPEKLPAVVVEEGPAAVSRNNRSDSA